MPSTREEIEAIGRWAVSKGIWVLTDEIYEHLVYGGAEHHSMPVLVPELADRCLVANGVAKTYAMTGWRVGWLIGPTDAVVAATNIQSHETSNVANVSQRAALAAVSGGLEDVAMMRAAFDRRRLTITSMLNDIEGVVCVEPEGAFTPTPRSRGCSGDPSGDNVRRAARSGRDLHQRSQGGGGARRGVRRARLLPHVLRAGRRGPGRGCQPVGCAVRRGARLTNESVGAIGGGSEETTVVARVLVTEKIAQSGLDLLAEAGHTVDVQEGLSPEQLLEAVPGVGALIIRSATQVTAEVLAAGTALAVVGRAGVGLDNVDVNAATERGVMVVNAPTSNILSVAEQAMALLLAEARNIPQAHGAVGGRPLERSKWEGVELHGKVLGVVGLGRAGSLVAQRAHAFGMELIGFDPFVSRERARAMGVRLTSIEELVAEADFVSIHTPKTPETIGLFGRDLLAKAKPGIRIVNTARGGIVDEDALAEAIRDGIVAGAGLDVFAKEPCTESPLFELPGVVVSPHLGASTEEAQDKAGVTIAEQVLLALAGDFVPYAVNVAAGDVTDTVRGFMALAEQLGRFFVGLHDGLPDAIDMDYQGELAGESTGILTLSVLKGIFGGSTEEPVSYVNAPQLAERRGLQVRESSTATSHDYKSLITLRSGSHSVAGTLISAGLRTEPRIVIVDEHMVEVPPSTHMLVVRNDDRPGVIGIVGTALGTAGVSISSMAVGPSPSPPPP